MKMRVTTSRFESLARSLRSEKNARPNSWATATQDPVTTASGSDKKRAPALTVGLLPRRIRSLPLPVLIEYPGKQEFLQLGDIGLLSSPLQKCDDCSYNPSGFTRHFRTRELSLELLARPTENSEVSENVKELAGSLRLSLLFATFVSSVSLW
jgi:hypothetical protein